MGLLESWPLEVLPADLPQRLETEQEQGDGGLRLLRLECLLLLRQRRGDRSEVPGLLVALGRGREALEYLDQHQLLAQLSDHLLGLLRLEPERTATLLVDHMGDVAPEAAVAAMQSQALAGGQEAELWRRRLLTYLWRLHERDPALAEAYADAVVELLADFEPDKLVGFLSRTPGASLQHALRICSDRGRVPETVYILGRMGDSKGALKLILDRTKVWVGAALGALGRRGRPAPLLPPLLRTSVRRWSLFPSSTTRSFGSI